MSESDELSHLISLIYDAALDLALWPAVLEETAKFLRSATATLGSYDFLQASGISYSFSWGDDPAYTALYTERYAKLNPLIPASGETSTGDIVSTTSFMSREELVATQFYQEWAKPQGYVDAAQATLEKSGTALAVLAAVRHESVGPVDDEMRRRMALLVPHFRRAVLIGKIIDLKTVQAAAFAETIDGLAAGVFLVDGHGVVVHANASGTALLDDGAVVRLTRGILTTTDGPAGRNLNEAIAAAGHSEVDLAGQGLGVPLSGAGGQSYFAHVLPLASGARREAGHFHAAVAAVFVRKATLDLAMPVESVARRYELTPTETKVLRAVVDHGGVTPIAATLGVSEATVKTHLQRLFRKTGTSRQVDLVKLTLGFADSLGSQKSAEHQPNG
jgi:DNA-binding CsgD family transcriptional regulator